MVNNEPTTQAIAVSLGIEVMNRAPLLRTCEVAVILVLGWESERGPRGPGWLISLRQRLALRDRPPSADSGTRESAWSPRRCAVCGLHARCAARRGAGRRGAGGTACMVVSGGHRSLTRSITIYPRSVAGGSLFSGDPATSLQKPRATHAKGDHVSDTVPQTPALLQMVFSVLQIRWHADEASRPLRLYVAWGDTSEEH